MKAWLAATCLFLSVIVKAQIRLTAGTYNGGGWECTLSYSNDGSIILVAPKYTHVYKPNGNTFSYIHTNGVDYRIMPLDAKSFKVYHQGSPDDFTRYVYIGGVVVPDAGEVAKVDAAVTYKKIAEKYRDKMKSDPKDVQTYAYCAAAALARSSYDEVNYITYTKKIVASLKLLLINKQRCPCEDAIPQSIWESVPQ